MKSSCKPEASRYCGSILTADKQTAIHDFQAAYRVMLIKQHSNAMRQTVKEVMSNLGETSLVDLTNRYQDPRNELESRTFTTFAVLGLR